VLNYQIIASEGATVASTVTYLLPVIAIVLDVLVLGETITLTVLAGIALVLVGVALTRRRRPAAGQRGKGHSPPMGAAWPAASSTPAHRRGPLSAPPFPRTCRSPGHPPLRTP
jgi:hypothetical protein